MTTMTNIQPIRELTADDLDCVSGGNPLLGRALIAVAGYLGGKIIDGIVDDSGVLASIEFKGGKVLVGGKPIK